MGLRRWLTRDIRKKLEVIKEDNLRLKEKVNELQKIINPIHTVEKSHIEKIYDKYKLNNTIDLSHDLYVDGDITIGDYTYIRKNSLIRNVSIGRYCAIATNVNISPINHPTDWLSIHHFQPNSINNMNKVKTTIGNDVWIGSNVTIMGVTIGDGAIVGASAIVTKDIPPYAIAVGVPAKIIKYRFQPEIIKELIALEWWNIDADILLENKVDFSNINKAIEQIKKIKNC